MVPSVLFLLGLAVAVAGVALICIPAGMIVGGSLIAVVSGFAALNSAPPEPDGSEGTK